MKIVLHGVTVKSIEGIEGIESMIHNYNEIVQKLYDLGYRTHSVETKDEMLVNDFEKELPNLCSRQKFVEELKKIPAYLILESIEWVVNE